MEDNDGEGIFEGCRFGNLHQNDQINYYSKDFDTEYVLATNDYGADIHLSTWVSGLDVDIVSGDYFHIENLNFNVVVKNKKTLEYNCNIPSEIFGKITSCKLQLYVDSTYDAENNKAGAGCIYMRH